MIATANEILRVLKSKWDIVIPDNIVVNIELDYRWQLPVATTELVSMKREGDVLLLRFFTSFGLFHQDKIEYNDVMVALLENVNGYLSELRHDLIIAELTYPPRISRRQISCGQ